MMGQDVQLVMLGTGRPDLEEMLKNFKNQHRDKVRGWVGFSVKTAHPITAGADILLIPSRFEPCGLNHLYATNYGTIPIVHAVGGLRDTVQPFDPFSESGLGWTFDGADAGKLIYALGNCLLTYRDYKKSGEGLQRRGMMQDLSWDLGPCCSVVRGSPRCRQVPMVSLRSSYQTFLAFYYLGVGRYIKSCDTFSIACQQWFMD